MKCLTENRVEEEESEMGDPREDGCYMLVFKEGILDLQMDMSLTSSWSKDETEG